MNKATNLGPGTDVVDSLVSGVGEALKQDATRTSTGGQHRNALGMGPLGGRRGEVRRSKENLDSLLRNLNNLHLALAQHPEHQRSVRVAIDQAIECVQLNASLQVHLQQALTHNSAVTQSLYNLFD